LSEEALLVQQILATKKRACIKTPGNYFPIWAIFRLFYTPRHY
jgi:hypothetical protein